MSLTLKSNSQFNGINSIPTQPPLPKDASLYMNFRDSLYIIKDLPTGNINRTLNLTDVAQFTRTVGTAPLALVGPSGLIEYKSNNDPGFEYDLGGNRLGIRFVPTMTNQFIYSNDFSQSVWAKTGITVTQNGGISPDGSNTAWTVTEDMSNGLHCIEETNFANANGAYYGVSYYVKMGTARYVQISGISSTGARKYVNFDLLQGTVTAVSQNIQSVDVELAPNGFYRICVVASFSPGAATMPMRLAIISSPTEALDINHVGENLNYILWQSQLEPSEGVTPIIPTTGTVATRNADTLQLGTLSTMTYPSQSFISLTGEYTIFCKYRAAQEKLDTNSGAYNGSEALWCMDLATGASQNSDFTRCNVSALNAGTTGGTMRISVTAGGVNLTNSPTKMISILPFPIENGRHSSVICGIKNSQNAIYDGETLDTSNPTALTHIPSRMIIGHARSTDSKNNVWGGIIEEVIYWPIRLTDEEMMAAFDALY